jgi:hypothetical protein
MRFSLMIHSDKCVIAPREPSHGKNMTFQLLSMLEINCFAFFCLLLQDAVAVSASDCAMIDELERTGLASVPAEMRTHELPFTSLEHFR